MIQALKPQRNASPAAVNPLGPAPTKRTSTSRSFPDCKGKVGIMNGGRVRRSRNLTPWGDCWRVTLIPSRSSKGMTASPKQPAVSRLDVERHRQALLTAAAEELSRNPESSMEDVAQSANLTRATLYRHFSNHQTLLKAIQAEAFAHAGQTLSDCDLVEGTTMEAFLRGVSALSRQGMRFRIILTRTPEHRARFLNPPCAGSSSPPGRGPTGARDGDIRADLVLRTLVDGLSTADRAALEKTRLCCLTSYALVVRRPQPRCRADKPQRETRSEIASDFGRIQ